MVSSRSVGILLLHLNLFSVFSRISGDNIEVSITDGRILGRKLETDKGTQFFAFQDIPYAKPPIDELRFKAPVPPEKWEGVLNTTENRKVCIQFSKPDDPRENEDCLVLNVYTPSNLNGLDKSSLPVMVWIHGGSFLRWFGTMDAFGPDYFIDKNLIVVTMNYRLGPLGFLTTGDGVIPANIGLKDQHMALKWVNKNIEIFGGDPSKVTLAGQSAGAVAVGYHTMSEKSKGLFRASMMQSATPLNCWSLQKHPEIAANMYVASLKWNSKLLGALLGHKNTPSEEALKILQKASVANLKKSSDITLQIPLDKKNCHSFTSLIWPPVYENDRNEDALVTGMNHENIKNGNINKVPILIGINSEESLLFGANEIRLQCSLLDVNQPAIVSQNMNLENGNRTPAGRSIKRMYTQSLFAFSTAASLNFASDMLFATPVARHAYLQSKYTEVFFYQFSHLGKLGRLVESDVEGARGVGHQEEIEYLFRTNNNKDLTQFPAEDVLTHDRLVELWSQFIKYMNPTKKRTDILQGTVWPKVSQEQFSYLNINTTLIVSEDPKKYREYSAIYSKYAENRLDTY